MKNKKKWNWLIIHLSVEQARESARLLLVISLKKPRSECTGSYRANLKFFDLLHIFCFVIMLDLPIEDVGLSKTFVKETKAHLSEEVALWVTLPECLPAFKWSKIILVFIQPFKKSLIFASLFMIAWKARAIPKECQEVCHGGTHVEAHVTLS